MAETPDFPLEVDVHWLSEKLDRKDDIFLLDVREGWERDISVIRDSFAVPMSEVPERIDELPKDKPIVVICRVGGRSAQVTNWLRAQGFENAINLSGGMNSWASEIDTKMSTY